MVKPQKDNRVEKICIEDNKLDISYEGIGPK